MYKDVECVKATVLEMIEANESRQEESVCL